LQGGQRLSPFLCGCTRACPFISCLLFFFRRRCLILIRTGFFSLSLLPPFLRPLRKLSTRLRDALPGFRHTKKVHFTTRLFSLSRFRNSCFSLEKAPPFFLVELIFSNGRAFIPVIPSFVGEASFRGQSFTPLDARFFVSPFLCPHHPRYSYEPASFCRIAISHPCSAAKLPDTPLLSPLIQVSSRHFFESFWFCL